MKYLYLMVHAIQDALSDKTRTLVSKEKVSACCHELAQVILKTYKPDLVIVIDAGGSIPGELIAEDLGVPAIHLVVRRKIEIARRYSLDPIPMRWIMSFYHHFLFQTVTPVVSSGIEVAIEGKKLLIVDDAIHTGKTIDVAVSYLKNALASEIKIASLSYVSTRRSDFVALPRGNYCFPWSKDYDALQTGVSDSKN